MCPEQSPLTVSRVLEPRTPYRLPIWTWCLHKRPRSSGEFLEPRGSPVDHSLGLAPVWSQRGLWRPLPPDPWRPSSVDASVGKVCE